MKKIGLDKIGALLARFKETMNIYVPVKRGSESDFVLWDGEEVDLDTLKTAHSPKSCVFPQSEDVVAFQVDGKKISVEPARHEEEDYLVFGVRACDVRALEILDKVFLADPVDTFYEARRRHGTVVGYACARPEASCFCTRFGIDPVAPASDVVVTRVGDCLLWEALSEKGKALSEKAGEFLEEASAEELEALEKTRTETHEIVSRLPFAGLSLAGFDGEHLMERFDAPEWGALSESCLGCGACTFVCPTCQCYDIRDFKANGVIKRYRCWDSCMYNDFTMMAHGNPRTTKLQRFRQRFMHKLVYFPANNGGVYSCVGCGRCVEKCPASLHIAKVIRTLGGKSDERV